MGDPLPRFCLKPARVDVAFLPDGSISKKLCKPATPVLQQLIDIYFVFVKRKSKQGICARLRAFYVVVHRRHKGKNANIQTSFLPPDFHHILVMIKEMQKMCG